MRDIRYVGPSDSRGLSAADFEKFGIAKGKDHLFPRFQPVEVTNAVSEVLLGPAFYGEFAELTEDEKKALIPQEDPEQVDDPELPEGPDATGDQHPQQTTDSGGPSGTASTP